MKKFAIVITLLAAAAISAGAQSGEVVKTAADTSVVSLQDQLRQDLGGDQFSTVQTLSIRNNSHWFAGASLGAGFYAAEQNRFAANFYSRSTPAFQAHVGKWVSPAWAVRFTAGAGYFRNEYAPISWWNMYEPGDHSSIPAEAQQYFHKDEIGISWFSRKFSYVDTSLDIMYDLTRWFTDEQTPFDLLFFFGPGFTYALPSQGFSRNNSLTFNAGGTIDARLTDKLRLTFTVEGTIVDESLDGQLNGFNSSKINRTIEGYAKAFMGLSYRWGARKPSKYVKLSPVVAERTYTTRTVIPQPLVAPKEDYKAPFVVRFYIDQYNIEPDQELNITKVCTYLEEHPEARLLMTGHCDPETANPVYNKALSKRRCDSVMKYIDSHFKIDHSRIEVKPMGDTQRNFEEDFRWNRCVILTIIED